MKTPKQESQKRRRGPEAKTARQHKERVSAKGKAFCHAHHYEKHCPECSECRNLFRRKAKRTKMEIAGGPQHQQHTGQ